MKLNDFASEAGHFYEPLTGEPRYTYTNAKGGVSKTTAREARKFGWVPSVTGILKLAAAPGLEKWKIGNAVMAALTLPRIDGESDDDYIGRILVDSEERARTARNTGTEIHGAIERMDTEGPYADHVGVAMDAVNAWAGAQDWHAERSFATRAYGGKVDLHGASHVLDFKTTDKSLDGLKTWEDHRRQLAAYRFGLGIPTARAAIVYVSSVKPEARVIEIEEDDLVRGWREFSALLNLWYAKFNMEVPT